MTESQVAKQKAQRGAERALAASKALVHAMDALEPAGHLVARPAGRTSAPARAPSTRQVELADDPSDVGRVTLFTGGNESPDQTSAKIAVAPLLPGTQTIKAFTDYMFSDGGATPGSVAEALRLKSAAVHGNDLKDAESTLVIQAAALDAIFNRLAFKAAQNMGSMDAMERYLRLAFKAQAQSCRTLEVLAAMKNPTVFARQANVNMGGQQQVNNGVDPEAPQVVPRLPRARAAKQSA